MKIPRFKYDRDLGATSRLRPQNYPHPRWVQLAKIDNQALGELKDSGTNGIFVIATRPLPVNSGGKTIRRILIFDNHPDSLRLVSGYRGEDSHFHVFDSLRTISWGVALLWILAVGLMMAMFWPL
jgi:hypothetical protein